MRAILICVGIGLAVVSPAEALVGGADVVRGTGAGRHIVMIISTRGSLCTGTALARDLVLTGGHCVAPAASYRVLLPDIKPPGLAIRSISVHPRYSPKDYASGRVTADVALLKLEAAAAGGHRAGGACAGRRRSQPGDRFVIAGYGGTSPGSEAGNGVPRAAALVATGKPGNLQIRLFDPATRDARPGLGACTGDSGGPAFVESSGTFAVIGVVSWALGAATTGGCGGLTGVTPLRSTADGLSTARESSAARWSLERPGFAARVCCTISIRSVAAPHDLPAPDGNFSARSEFQFTSDLPGALVANLRLMKSWRIKISCGERRLLRVLACGCRVRRDVSKKSGADHASRRAAIVVCRVGVRSKRGPCAARVRAVGTGRFRPARGQCLLDAIPPAAVVHGHPTEPAGSGRRSRSVSIGRLRHRPDHLVPVRDRRGVLR